jgi:hypothetical protein
MGRKLLAAFGLVLGVAGFLGFTGIAVGTWYAKREADRELRNAMEKAHQAADVAARFIGLIREMIARANASLATARADSAVQPATGQSDPLVSVAVWKAKRELPGEVERARDAVGIASEAVVVAGAALDVFGEHKTEESAYGVKPQDLDTARSQLDSAASGLKNARTVLGVSFPTATPEQLSQVEKALELATQVTDQSDRAVTEARGKVDRINGQAQRWAMRGALSLSGIAALAALGQVFLVRACWKGLKGLN